MELDFSGLQAISGPAAAFKKSGDSRNTTAAQKPTQGQISATQAAGSLAVEIVPTDELFRDKTAPHAERPVGLARLERIQEENQRLSEMYKRQAENIRKSEALRTKVQKGIAAGVDTFTLLLQAMECISLMTGDTVFYDQGKADLVAIYGEGFLQTAPLQEELNSVDGRIARMMESLMRAPDQDTRQRIERAIKAHQDKADYLRRLMGRA